MSMVAGSIPDYGSSTVVNMIFYLSLGWEIFYQLHAVHSCAPLGVHTCICTCSDLALHMHMYVL